MDHIEIRALFAENDALKAEREDHADMLDRISELVGVSTEYDESHVLLEDAVKENVADLAEAVALLRLFTDTFECECEEPSCPTCAARAFLARHTETNGESDD